MNDQVKVATESEENAPSRRGIFVTRDDLHVTVLKPQTAISVAVDTEYIAARGSGGWINGGIYMFDNRQSLGSRGEGSEELATVCNAGNLIGWHAYPINRLGPSGDTVKITGMNVSTGNVFGSSGWPVKYSEDGSYWVGQAMNVGRQTYQIRLAVTVGRLDPITYNLWWDPFIIAK